MPRGVHCSRLVLAFLLVSLIAGVSAAAVPPGASTGAAWPPDDSLVFYPEEIVLSEQPAVQEELRKAHPGLKGFLEDRPGWKATLDPYTQSVDRAFGDGLALPGYEAGASPSLRALGERFALDFLDEHRSLLAPDLDVSSRSLVLNEKTSIELPDPAGRVIQFDLQKDGLPVLGAGLTLGLRDGKVVFLASSALGTVATSSTPRTKADEAVGSVSRYLESGGSPAPPLRLQRQPSLAFYPRLEPSGLTKALRHHLVWILELRPEEAQRWEGYLAYVDAHDGQVLAFFPEAQTVGSCSADPKQAHGTVQGGVRPNRADDPEKSLNLPFARVNVDGKLLPTNINGRYLYPGGVASSALDGELFRAHCDSCSNPAAQPLATGDESGLIDFGLGGAAGPAPVAGNGTSTSADRTTFFQVNQARLLLGKWNNAFFNEIDTFVNINSSCNAFSSGYMLGFFAKGGNCNNTGEIRDVVQHELGHTWDRTDGNGITSGGMSEWKGDILALFIGGDSCVGESFRLSGGSTSACSGVRDIDEKAPGRTDHPLTPAQCPTCATLTRTTNNCGGGVHCTGEISGQAVWHLLNNLTTGADYVTGVPLAAGNPALSSEQARWVLERLLIAGGPPMQTWNPTASGVSIYDAMMLVDDDDGNLANGTPHAAYINAALSHHEIAESPLVGDSADCAPLADPIVSATLDRDASTSLPMVRIAWTPVGGATTFDVYRNSRAGDGFLPLAQNVAAGPFLDTGVQVGITYRYLVVAVRKTGCATISPGTNVASVTVTPAELAVASKIVSEAPSGSDGDGLIEPGERVSIQITLQETGGAAPATSVTATATSGSPTTSPVTAGGPISFGTVPAGGTAAGSSAFEVFVGPSEPCDGRVHVVLSASGNEGCWLDGVDIPIAKASDGCTTSAAAFVEVVPGSPQVTVGGGDGDGIADNCEATTVSYQIRNSGSLPSGAVLSSADSSHPGVTFAPRPGCTLANLTPGASAPCQFTFSLGGATSAGVPFTLTADSAGNPAPSTLEFVLGAETNPPVFSTVTYGFEAGFDGWTSQKFAFVANRAASGFRSVRAGSTTLNNICGKLTSPALRLSPSSPSTLSLQMYADIEPLTDQWYDRANVHLVDLETGQHVLLVPTSGPAYNASGTLDGGLCHIPGQNGWAGFLGGFQLVTFDLSPFAGHRIRIELNYDSDEGDDREGVYFDDVTITNATSATLPPDLQGNTCTVPEVSAAAAVIPLKVQSLPGDLYRLTWQDLGSGFQYNTYAGALGSFYSHGASPVLCSGLGAGVTCDGTACTLDRPGAGLPAGDLYFLVTATAFGAEGTAGFATSGAERDPAQSTCAP